MLAPPLKPLYILSAHHALCTTRHARNTPQSMHTQLAHMHSPALASAARALTHCVVAAVMVSGDDDAGS